MSAIDRGAGAPACSPAVAGFRVGVLTLETRHRIVPGNAQHATSFPFPVIYGFVRGVGLPALMAGDQSAAERISEAAAELESRGVEAIVGACGSFANYQSALSRRVRIPVWSSVMLQLPSLLAALPPDRRLAVIFANAASYTERVRRECAIDDRDGRIVPLSANVLPAFAPILDPSQSLDSERLRREVVQLAREHCAARPDVGAYVLQCSDLPPYAADIRRATGRPVFDVCTLIRYVHDALRPPVMPSD